jgi:hypothetical protein
MHSRTLKFHLIAFATVFMLLAGVAARATDLTVKCIAPTKNTDGTAISSSATINFNVYGGMQGTTPLPLITATPLASCLRTAPNVNPGVICYAVTAVETLNGQSAESAQTVPICTTVNPPTPTPLPPGGTTVTVSVPGVANTIYILEKSADQLVFVPAGTIPAGTACDATQTITQKGGTYNVVPHAAVIWSGTVTSLTAFAKCS